MRTHHRPTSILALGAVLAVLIACRPLPANADVPITAGGGAAQSFIAYTTPFPVLPNTGADAWYSGASGVATVFNTSATAFAGPVSMSMQGSSTSASLAGESGPVSILISSDGWPTNGFLDCDGEYGSSRLGGGYVRFFGVVVMQVAGNCTVNYWITPTELLIGGSATWSPLYNQPSQNGVTAPLKTFDFEYAFAALIPVPTPTT